MFIAEFALFLLCIGLLARIYQKNKHGWASLISIFCYLFGLMYLLRHAILLFDLDKPIPDDLFLFDAAPQRFFVLFNVALFLLGFLLAQNLRTSPWLLKIFPLSPHSVRPFRASVVLGISIALVSLIVIYLFSVGGSDPARISYAVRVERVFSGFSFLSNINVFAAYFCAAFGFQSKHYRDPSKINLGRTVLLLSLSLLLILPSALMADRDNLVFFLVFLVIGTSLYVSPSFKYFALPLGVLAIWLIVELQSVRLSAWGYDKEYSSIFRKISSGLNHQFYDSYILLVKGIESDWFSPTGLHLGFDYLLGILGVIPRFLWPEKPEMVDPGIWFSTQFIPDATYGWPVSVIGEWWLNFGVVGSFIGGTLSGILYKSATLKYTDFRSNPYSYMAAYVLATRVITLGYSTSTPMFYVLNIIPLFLLFSILRQAR